MTVTGERGQALIEVVLVGLLLLAPLLWGLGVLAQLHRGALAATSAAREAGLDAARAAGAAQARRSGERALVQAFIDHGLDARRVEARWSMDPRLERGSAVEVEVSYPVSVLQAPFLGSVSGPSIWIRARHVARVDPFRSRD